MTNHNRSPPLLFRQLFERDSSTYTYLLADTSDTGTTLHPAVLVDPVLETVDRDAQLVRDLGLDLLFILETHVHADHVTGARALLDMFPRAQYAVGAANGRNLQCESQCVRLLRESDRVVFGGRHLSVLETPGHTNGCVSYVLDDESLCLTGDALLIRACARTDFQEGCPATLFSSITHKLYARLPDHCLVYPAHDYRGMTVSTIAEEKRLNARIPHGQTLERFTEIMSTLRLPRPAKIDVALPANLQCGNRGDHSGSNGDDEGGDGSDLRRLQHG